MRGSAATWYAYHIGYVAIMGLIKLSILFFYLNFATQRTFRILVHVSVVVVGLVTVLMIFILAFQCPKKPSIAASPAFFTASDSECWDMKYVLYPLAGFNIASDLFILILPLPLLSSLRMRRIKRVSLIAVFSAGLLVPIASGVRLWAVYLWATAGALSRYYGAYIIFWSQVEINTAIICASVPSFQPLFKRIFRNVSKFQQSSRSPDYYYAGQNVQERTPETGLIRPITYDSVSFLELPSRTYRSSHLRSRDKSQPRIIVAKRSREEQELRDRVREFSTRSSLYSHPSSRQSAITPTAQVDPSLRTGWV